MNNREYHAYQPLKYEIELFRQWAALYLESPRSGEWECDYDRWGNIWTALDQFLEEVSFEQWNQEVTGGILYVIARDNEIENSLDALAGDPQRLLFLARAALNSTEVDAKWQIANRLGDLPERISEVEPILLEFIERSPFCDKTDRNEYVSRQALLALGRLKSTKAEKLAEVAWGAGYEYQRIAALHVFYEIGSSQLENYLQLAESDNSLYLRQNAALLRAGHRHPA